MEAIIAARIAAELAKPITHSVVTTYSDGSNYMHNVRDLKIAERHLAGENRKLGKSYKCRNTGAMVTVVSVELVTL